LLPKDEEILEGALKHHVEAGFVAVEQGEFRRVVGAGEAGGHAVQGTGGRVGRRDGIEEAVFDGPRAAHAPEGGDHLFDHADFDGVEGIEAVEIGTEESLKCFIGFVVEHDEFGEEPVTQGVPGGEAFAAGSFWPAGERAVGAGGSYTFIR